MRQAAKKQLAAGTVCCELCSSFITNVRSVVIDSVPSWTLTIDSFPFSVDCHDT